MANNREVAGIGIYDEAIAQAIESWLKPSVKANQGTGLKVLRPNETAELFKMTDDMREDRMLTLPLIGLSREPAIELLAPNKQPRSYAGPSFQQTKDSKALILNSIDARITYQIDVYTKTFAAGDEYVRDLVFKFVNHPELFVTLTLNGVEYTHNFTMRLASTIEDNSDVPQRLFRDQFTRWTLRLVVDDARLWSIPMKRRYNIKGVVFEVLNKDGDVEEEDEIEIG